MWNNNINCWLIEFLICWYIMIIIYCNEHPGTISEIKLIVLFLLIPILELKIHLWALLLLAWSLWKYSSNRRKRFQRTVLSPNYARNNEFRVWPLYLILLAATMWKVCADKARWMVLWWSSLHNEWTINEL